MTAVVTFVMFFLIAAHYTAIGPFMAEGYTIYTVAFKVVTIAAVTFCLTRFVRKHDWCTFRAGCAIFAYAVLAPKVYNYEQAILLSALLDLMMASYFILLGQKRWESIAGGFFLVCVGVSVLTALGVIPSHLDRPWPQFLAWSHGDITAVLNYCSLGVIGFGAGDGGRKIYALLSHDAVGLDMRRRAVSKLVSLA